jgi:hypothetical protein
MAGAGFGVALAGATGSSDQYTHGAKPYAGVRPDNITVGTNTYPSTVTTISATTTTETVAVTSPYTTVEVTDLTGALIDAIDALNSEKSSAATLSAQFSALLKGDLRSLLEGTGNYTKIATLAKAKSVPLTFISPGSGKVSVKWEVAAPGKRGVFYANYTGTLKKLGTVEVKLPSTAAGRKALSKASKANVVATVTYTGTSNNSIKVSRGYKLVG